MLAPRKPKGRVSRPFSSCRTLKSRAICWAMNRPPTPASARSSPNWSDLRLEVSGSARLAWAWASWCSGLAVAIWAGSALPVAVRGAAVLLTLAGAGRGVVVLLARRADDIEHLCWQGDGRWLLRDRRGRGAYVQPQTPQRLGALLWLRWHSDGRRRILIIDGALVEPNDWRRLKARLKFRTPGGVDGAR